MCWILTFDFHSSYMSNILNFSQFLSDMSFEWLPDIMHIEDVDNLFFLLDRKKGCFFSHFFVSRFFFSFIFKVIIERPLSDYFFFFFLIFEYYEEPLLWIRRFGLILSHETTKKRLDGKHNELNWIFPECYSWWHEIFPPILMNKWWPKKTKNFTHHFHSRQSFIYQKNENKNENKNKFLLLLRKQPHQDPHTHTLTATWILLNFFLNFSHLFFGIFRSIIIR